MLTKYYKFHNDLGRLFMEPLGKMMFIYQNFRRKADYKRIALLIRQEQLKDKIDPLKLQPLKIEKSFSLIHELSSFQLRDNQVLKNLK